VPPTAAPALVAGNGDAATLPGYGRDRPVRAIFRSAVRISGETSGKDTRHVVLDISGSGLAYAPPATPASRWGRPAASSGGVLPTARWRRGRRQSASHWLT